jgi:hypothetical protein
VENVGDVLLMTDYLRIALFALCTASLAHFFQECLEPGMIFGRYGLWLQYIHRHSWRRKDQWRRYWIKPMGNCIYCNGTWICIALFVLVNFEWPLLPLALGLNYVWTKLILKL